jgi:pimeloyl-ACP methyl ester carboxylesterase
VDASASRRAAGVAGSGEPTRTLDVPGYAAAVVEWLDGAELGPVVLAGHSSGTQVAARAAVLAGERRNTQVVAVVLASPTVAVVATGSCRSGGPRR